MASRIQEYLDKILGAVYGVDVRDAIHDSISECYTDVTAAKTVADEAASNANASASNADEKASLAAAAVESVNTAISDASEAKEACETAAANAAEKALLAEDAAADATQKANAANTAAENANEKAVIASEAAGNVNIAIEKAESAASSATTATTEANAARDAANLAAQNATTAAGNANAAVSNANTAASNADSKASRATAAANNADEKAIAANSAAASATQATQDAIAAKDAATAAAQNANEKAVLADNARSSATEATLSANNAAAEANAAASKANEATSNAETAISDCMMATYNATVAASSANSAGDRADAAAQAIDGLSVTYEDGGPDVVPEAVISEIGGHKNIHFRLKQGANGLPFLIKGNAFASLSDLQEGVISPEVGDQYNVGDEPPYNVYRWTGTAWEDQGKIGATVSEITNEEIDTVYSEGTVPQATGKFLSLSGFIHFVVNKLKTSLNGKVDKVSGKGLSANDFTDAHKAKISELDSNVSALISTKVDKVTGKSLTTNDFTDEYKEKVDNNEQTVEQVSQLTQSLDERVTNLEGSGALLWENPAPTSDFAAQTVTLSQSAENFDYLLVLVAGNKNISSAYYVYTQIHTSGKSLLSCFQLSQNVGDNVQETGFQQMFNQREAAVNGTSVAISKNVYWRPSGRNWGSTEPKYKYVGVDDRQDICIPLKIYGMKL